MNTDRTILIPARTATGNDLRLWNPGPSLISATERGAYVPDVPTTATGTSMLTKFDYGPWEPPKFRSKQDKQKIKRRRRLQKQRGHR